MPGDTTLITGAAGLLGRALALRLSAGGAPVVGIDRAAAPGDGPFPIVPGDVTDAECLADVVCRFDVGRIVHCGGVSGRAVGRDDPAETIRVNVMGTARVFDAARRFEVARVVLCSSGSVYGTTSRSPVVEDMPLAPVNAYGASKVGAEAILQAYAEDWGIDGVALRIFQVFGPRRRTRCHLKMMIEAALSGRPALIPHRADSRRQYVYIDDAVAALAAALDRPGLPLRAYNIAGGTSLTLRQVAATVAEVLPGVEVRFGDDPQSDEYTLGTIDQAAAARDLGFAPEFTLADGIRAYARWLRERGASSDSGG